MGAELGIAFGVPVRSQKHSRTKGWVLANRNSRLCRTESQIKDIRGFNGPILVFFQKYPQNRSKASKQCPMMIFDHQECSKPPDPGLEADLRISWLEGSISLDFAVRASRNNSEMEIFIDNIWSKLCSCDQKPSKRTSSNRISLLYL